MALKNQIIEIVNNGVSEFLELHPGLEYARLPMATEVSFNDILQQGLERVLAAKAVCEPKMTHHLPSDIDRQIKAEEWNMTTSHPSFERQIAPGILTPSTLDVAVPQSHIHPISVGTINSLSCGDKFKRCGSHTTTLGSLLKVSGATFAPDGSLTNINLLHSALALTAYCTENPRNIGIDAASAVMIPADSISQATGEINAKKAGPLLGVTTAIAAKYNRVMIEAMGDPQPQSARAKNCEKYLFSPGDVNAAIAAVEAHVKARPERANQEMALFFPRSHIEHCELKPVVANMSESQVRESICELGLDDPQNIENQKNRLVKTVACLRKMKTQSVKKSATLASAATTANTTPEPKVTVLTLPSPYNTRFQHPHTAKLDHQSNQYKAQRSNLGRPATSRNGNRTVSASGRGAGERVWSRGRGKGQK